MPAKKPAPKKPAKKAASTKKKTPVKKAASVAKKAASAAKKAAKKTVAKKPDSAAKKTVAKKTSASVKKEVKKPTAKAYKMQVIDDVIPNLVPHVVPSAGKVATNMKDLPKHLQPNKVQAGRMFLVEDEQMSQIDSLIEMQIDSYKWFLTEGLKELLEEISPITDFSGKKMELRVLGHSFDPPKYDPATCRRRNLSYEAVMK